MSSSRAYSFVEVRCCADRLSDFTRPTSSWVNNYANITYFDFDNHSEAYLAELALKLINESESCFLMIGATEDFAALGSIARFLNAITRKYVDKVTVIYQNDDKRLAPFYKVLKAGKYKDHEDAKNQLDSWIKALEIGLHLPEKGTDL